MIECTISTAVHTQAVSLSSGLLLVFGRRYCITINSCCILTAIDNNFDLSCGIITSNKVAAVTRF
jgi:hypothetical protein